MTRTIEVIKPINRFIDEATKAVIRKKRVCAYARVSTDEVDQINSFNFQIEEYTRRIKENPSWEFIGMFADQGITGTQTEKTPRIHENGHFSQARRA